MRLPFRDVIPTRTVAALSLVLPWLCVAFDLWREAAWMVGLPCVPALLCSGVCLVSLGETLEDQFGRPRLLLLTSLAMGVLALRPSAGPLAAATGAWVGAYLVLFAQSKVLVWAGPRVIEVPVLFLSACWLLTTIVAWPPAEWPVPAVTLLLGLATGRLLRRAGRGDWAHFDQFHTR